MSGEQVRSFGRVLRATLSRWAEARRMRAAVSGLPEGEWIAVPVAVGRRLRPSAVPGPAEVRRP